MYDTVVGSRYHTDAEVQAENELRYTIIQTAVDYYKSEYGLDFTKDSYPRYFSYSNMHEGYWFISLASVYADSVIYLDAQTLKPIPVEKMLCENWRDYSCGKYLDKKAFLLYFEKVNHNLRAYIQYSDPSDRDFYGEESVLIPLEEINGKYISY